MKRRSSSVTTVMKALSPGPEMWYLRVKERPPRKSVERRRRRSAAEQRRSTAMKRFSPPR
ncbi:hypothetical protein Scep_023054 [Stephania cephalantha]|uniref:Uncharacterized protein n=1 Tax=Stephania cephalantha TaxID=152367 RepID=A0AAP0F6L3_9MAGN